MLISRAIAHVLVWYLDMYLSLRFASAFEASDEFLGMALGAETAGSAEIDRELIDVERCTIGLNEAVFSFGATHYSVVIVTSSTYKYIIMRIYT